MKEALSRDRCLPHESMCIVKKAGRNAWITTMSSKEVLFKSGERQIHEQTLAKAVCLPFASAIGFSRILVACRNQCDHFHAVLVATRSVFVTKRVSIDRRRNNRGMMAWRTPTKVRLRRTISASWTGRTSNQRDEPY